MTLLIEIDAAIQKSGFANRKSFAKTMDISEAYLSDMMNERKMFTPILIDRAVAILKVGPTKRRRWHILCAIQHGWRVR